MSPIENKNNQKGMVRTVVKNDGQSSSHPKHVLLVVKSLKCVAINGALLALFVYRSRVALLVSDSDSLSKLPVHIPKIHRLATKRKLLE